MRFVLILFMILSSNTYAQHYYWESSPTITYNSSLDEDQVFMIKYAAWIISNRINMPLEVKEGTSGVGNIHFNIVSKEQMKQISGSDTVSGVAQRWVWVRNREAISRSNISISEDVAQLNRCSARVFVHELWHAITSSGHTKDPFDVMYYTTFHCLFDNYALTDSDLSRAHPVYDIDRCFVELTPELEINAPNAGSGYILRRTSDLTWKIRFEFTSQSDCSVRNKDGVLVLDDVRSFDGNYSAKFVPISDNEVMLVESKEKYVEDEMIRSTPLIPYLLGEEMLIEEYHHDH